MIYLWTKTLHLLFVIAWMACVFYLPRILVNLAETAGQPAVQDRLALMGRRLVRFGHVMFGVMLGLGLLLWFGRLVAPHWWPHVTAGGGWMHAKFAGVVLLLGYFVWSARELNALAAGRAPRSARWYRWVNELPLLITVPVIWLVLAKPF